MNIATRQRAVRSIVSALISADFSESEIDEIADALESSKEFHFLLGSALLDVSKRLSTESRQAPAVAATQTLTKSAIETLGLINKLGITQRHLLDIIDKVAPQSALELRRKRLATTKLVEVLFKDTGEVGHKLLTELRARRAPAAGFGAGDPYLDLIDKRKD